MPQAGGQDQRLGVALVAGAAVAWSTAGYFAHLIHVSLFPMLVWRNAFGGVFMLLFLLSTERGATFRAFRSLGRIGWFAAVVNGLSMICYLAALRHTSVANVVVIYATAPFVAAALAFLLYRDRASRRTLATGLLALVRRRDHRRRDARLDGTARRPARAGDDARGRDLHDHRPAPSRPFDGRGRRPRRPGSAS